VIFEAKSGPRNLFDARLSHKSVEGKPFALQAHRPWKRHSLIEDSDDGIDAFRIWRRKFPEELTAISALETGIDPLRADLRIFRNKLGFHGSRSFQQESRGLDVFGNHSATKLMEAMKCFKALSAALLEMDMARQENSCERLSKARMRIDSISIRSNSISKM
jgi:hypothetical protein